MSKLLSNTPRRFTAGPTPEAKGGKRVMRNAMCCLLVLCVPLLAATPSSATYQSFYAMVANIPAALKSAISIKAEKRTPTRQELWEGVLYASSQYKVKPSLIWAVITVASKFDPNAHSPEGAIGLMQLMPQTAAEMGVRNVNDPYENILGGTRYLRYLLDRFKGNTALAVAAYRAGPSAVERYRGIPPQRSTKTFVREVMKLAEKQ